MTLLILAALIFGIITGRSGYFTTYIAYGDAITTYALCLLLFSVGIDLGRNRAGWLRLKKLGRKIVLVPLSIAVGSIAGAVAVGFIITMPFNEAAAVGAGFGWYSLSGVLIARIYNIEVGTIAFMANIFRELIALILIPFLARKWGGYVTFAPGGATTMDTTLPLINKAAGPDIALVAFISGIFLSTLVPFLVPMLINFI